MPTPAPTTLAWLAALQRKPSLHPPLKGALEGWGRESIIGPTQWSSPSLLAPTSASPTPRLTPSSFAQEHERQPPAPIPSGALIPHQHSGLLPSGDPEGSAKQAEHGESGAPFNLFDNSACLASALPLEAIGPICRCY